MNAFRIRMFLAAADAGSGGTSAAASAAPAAGSSTGAGDGGSTGRAGPNSQLTAGDQAAAAAAAPATASLPEGYYALPTRPDWMPERFYDSEKKAARINDLAKSWMEADKTIKTKTEDLRKLVKEDFDKERMLARPETPEKYVAKLPDTIKLPDGREYKPDEKNPMMSWWRKTAHDAGLSQAQFEEGIAAYMQGAEYGAPDLDAEMKLLGENGQRRIDTVSTFLKSKLGEKHVAALAPAVTSAAVVEALEALIALNQSQPLGDQARQPVTIKNEAELRQMQQDPRYRDPFKRDPNFVREVQEGYKRLYGR